MPLGYSYPEPLYYDRKHSWLSVDGSLVVQGLTDFGQKIAGRIAFVQIPRVGREVHQGQALLSMESGKWVGRILATVSGKIVAVNQALEQTPALINDSPYEAGWLVKIEMSAPAELMQLLRVGTPEFEQFVEEEQTKYADKVRG